MKYQIIFFAAFTSLSVTASDPQEIDQDSIADFVAYMDGLDESIHEAMRNETPNFEAMSDRDLEEWIRKHDKPVWNYPYDSVVMNGNKITIDGRTYQFEEVDGQIRWKSVGKSSNPDFLWKTVRE